MIDLCKKLSRRVNMPLDNRIAVRSKDRITVTLYPEGYIGFRAHKCRHEFQVPLSSCYQMAIKIAAQEAFKIKEQEARLLGKRRPRKPRRSLLFL